METPDTPAQDPKRPGAEPPAATTQTLTPEQQREALLQSERAAHAQQPRNFKEDALDDKVVQVQPDGTGPTSTQTFDPQADREAGSGNPG